jgi:hypothetical protein
VPARRRHPTAVILRCRGDGHELLTIRPATGFGRFVVVRPPGRAGGAARDEDQWLRTGGGTEMNFATLPAQFREIDGGDASTVDGLLGDSPYLFCRCGSAMLDESTADRVGEALYSWHQSAAMGVARPVTIPVDIR